VNYLRIKKQKELIGKREISKTGGRNKIIEVNLLKKQANKP